MAQKTGRDNTNLGTGKEAVMASEMETFAQ
jgi:hypothetical protein